MQFVDVNAPNLYEQLGPAVVLVTSLQQQQQQNSLSAAHKLGSHSASLLHSTTLGLVPRTLQAESQPGTSHDGHDDSGTDSDGDGKSPGQGRQK